MTDLVGDQDPKHLTAASYPKSVTIIDVASQSIVSKSFVFDESEMKIKMKFWLKQLFLNVFNWHLK